MFIGMRQDDHGYDGASAEIYSSGRPKNAARYKCFISIDINNYWLINCFKHLKCRGTFPVLTTVFTPHHCFLLFYFEHETAAAQFTQQVVAR